MMTLEETEKFVRDVMKKNDPGKKLDPEIIRQVAKLILALRTKPETTE